MTRSSSSARRLAGRDAGGRRARLARLLLLAPLAAWAACGWAEGSAGTAARPGAADVLTIGPRDPVHRRIDGRFDAGDRLRPASAVAPGCPGRIREAPLYRLLHDGATRLRVAAAGEDLVLVVEGSRGQTFCDTSSGPDRTPFLSAHLAPGEARVWVGTTASAARRAYGVELHAEAAGGYPDPTGLDTRSPGTLGALRPGERPEGREGRTGADVEARVVSSGCPGWVPLGAHLTLDLEDPRLVRVEAAPQGDEDLTVLVREPSGAVWCDDDGGVGTLPYLAVPLPAGEHRLWVGTKHATTEAAFSLTVRSRPVAESMDSTGLAPAAGPRLGVVRPASNTEARVDGATDPFVHLAGVAEGCQGFAPSRPDVVLDVPYDRPLRLCWDEGLDLTVLIEDPSGRRRCLREEEGRTPWTRGRYPVWVASPRPDRVLPFTLTVFQPSARNTRGPANRPATSFTGTTTATLAPTEASHCGPS